MWPFAAKILTWPFDDPAEGSSGPDELSRFRRVRDEINEKIRQWLNELEDWEGDARPI